MPGYNPPPSSSSSILTPAQLAQGDARYHRVVAPRTVSSNYTATVDDDGILVDASGGTRTISLPTVSSVLGHEFFIQKIDSSSNGVTVDPAGAETIALINSSAVTSTTTTEQGDTLHIVAAATGWVQLPVTTFDFVGLPPAEIAMHFSASGSQTALVGNYPFTINGIASRGPGSYTVVARGPELLTNTNAIDNAAWTKTALTVVADNVAAPDGTTTADKLTQTAEFGNAKQTISLDPNGKTYYLGAWLKADIGVTAQLALTTPGNAETSFQNIAITTDWQYYEISKAFTLSAASISASIYPTPAGTTFTPIYAWGATLFQQVALSSFPYVVPAGWFLKATASLVPSGADYMLSIYGRQ